MFSNTNLAQVVNPHQQHGAHAQQNNFNMQPMSMPMQTQALKGRPLGKPPSSKALGRKTGQPLRSSLSLGKQNLSANAGMGVNGSGMAGNGIGGFQIGPASQVERFNEIQPTAAKNPKPPSRGSGIFGKPPMVSSYKPASRQKSRERVYNMGVAAANQGVRHSSLNLKMSGFSCIEDSFNIKLNKFGPLVRELNESTGNALGPSYAKSVKNQNHYGQGQVAVPKPKVWGSKSNSTGKKVHPQTNRPPSGGAAAFSLGVSGVRVSSARGKSRGAQERQFGTEERKTGSYSHGDPHSGARNNDFLPNVYSEQNTNNMQVIQDRQNQERLHMLSQQTEQLRQDNHRAQQMVQQQNQISLGANDKDLDFATKIKMKSQMLQQQRAEKMKRQVKKRR